MAPESFRGSVAGAFGMCQFVPSSALKWGVDGDGDGKLSLHRLHDAMFSIGNYLRAHGWKEGMGEKEKIAVIMEYNKSLPYATTVLKLSRRLR